MKYELPSTELIVIEENNYLKFGEYLNDMQCDDTANKLSLDDLEYVKKLKQENKILKENAENNDKVVDKVNWENMLLKKENQELNKKYVNAVADYETTMAEKVELEKQLQELGGVDEYNRYLLNQQKKFINYLEDKINMCDGFLDTIKSDLEEISPGGRLSNKTYIATQIMKNETGKKVYEEILQKYKEIIGVSDDY